MASNIYLVQALRAYREKSVGQFDQVSERSVQVTQDAANEIERLNAEVEALSRRMISVSGNPPYTAGILWTYSWQDLAMALDKHDSAFGPTTIHTIVVKPNGLETWAERKSK